jgi:hypothetical protein
MSKKTWKRENRSVVINDDLTIEVRYVGPTHLSKKAIPLDNEVLPLIVAAPDLLAAAKLAVEPLEAFAEYYNDSRSKGVVKALKKAIKKADPTYNE